jgi:hypothetical protein
MEHDVHPESDEGVLCRAVDSGEVARVLEVLARLGPQFRLSRLELVRRAYANGHRDLGEVLRTQARIPLSAIHLLTAPLVEHVPLALFVDRTNQGVPYRVVFQLEGERVMQDNGPLRAPEVVHGLKAALERLVDFFLYERAAPDEDVARALLRRVPKFSDLDSRQLAFAAAVAANPELFIWSAWLEVTEQDNAEGWLTVLSLDYDDQPGFGCAIQAAR